MARFRGETHTARMRKLRHAKKQDAPEAPQTRFSATVVQFAVAPTALKTPNSFATAKTPSVSEEGFVESTPAANIKNFASGGHVSRNITRLFDESERASEPPP